jgi:hypothetical protein
MGDFWEPGVFKFVQVTPLVTLGENWVKISIQEPSDLGLNS